MTLAAVGAAVGAYMVSPGSVPTSPTHQLEQLEPFSEDWPFTLKDVQYLLGGPNAEETDTPVELDIVQGKLPEGLNGTYYLNGPGINHFTDKEGHRRAKHPFDGHGFIRKFQFSARNNRVMYEGKYVRISTYNKEVLEEKGRMVYRGLGSNPYSTTSLGAVRNILAPTYGDGTANTCIVEYGNQLLALYEGGPPHLMDPKTLETKGIYTFNGRISRRRPFLAHTRVDHTRNRFVGCGWDSVNQFSMKSRFIFYEFDDKFELLHKQVFESDGLYQSHDFLITPNYYVLLCNPIAISVPGAIKAATGFGQLINVVEQDRSKTMKIAFVPRNSSRTEVVIDFGESALSVHHGMAYESTNDHVVLVTSAFDRYKFGNEFGFSPGSSVYTKRASSDGLGTQTLYKVTCDLARKTIVKKTALCSGKPCDFLSINQLMEGQGHGPAKHLFAATGSYTSNKMDLFDEITHFNVETEEVAGKYKVGRHRFVGESVFAPVVERRGPFEENNGYVVAAVYDGAEQKTYLMVFDGKHLSEGPVCTIDVKAQLPYGFHGSWCIDGASSSPAAKL